MISLVTCSQGLKQKRLHQHLAVETWWWSWIWNPKLWTVYWNTSSMFFWLLCLFCKEDGQKRFQHIIQKSNLYSFKRWNYNCKRIFIKLALRSELLKSQLIHCLCACHICSTIERGICSRSKKKDFWNVRERLHCRNWSFIGQRNWSVYQLYSNQCLSKSNTKGKYQSTNKWAFRYCALRRSGQIKVTSLCCSRDFVTFTDDVSNPLLISTRKHKSEMARWYSLF